MQRPHLALSVLVAATLCLPLVVGQPANSVTRCNPDTTATYTNNALDQASASKCCMWVFGVSGTPAPLVRSGVCDTATGETIDLSGKFISSINNPATAFANCGSPKLLDLSNNQITSITNVHFPPSLTHLSLKKNQISNIRGLTITLQQCNLVNDDPNCKLSSPNQDLAKSVDLSENLLTFIDQTTFAGTIVKLDLGNGGDVLKNPFATLPIGAVFPNTLTKLIFNLVAQNVWNSDVYCNGALPVTLNFTSNSTTNSFDPTKCCMWGGNLSTVAAERKLERLGSCPTALYQANVGLVLDSKQIGAIPADADPLRIAVFEGCGQPRELKLDSNSITSLTGVYLPTSLIILSLKNNQISQLSGLTTLSALKVLDLENNLLECLSSIQLPAALTHLSFKNNRIVSIKDVPIALKDCASTSDSACKLDSYAGTTYAQYSTRPKTLDLSENLLKSIAGARFSGSIDNLDLSSVEGANALSPARNPFETLPIGAFLAPSTTNLVFNDIPLNSTTRWRSAIRCNDNVVSNFPTSFDPTKCCMWGGSKAVGGAPLERLGTCSSASGGQISLRSNASLPYLTVRFIDPLPTRLAEAISSIPADAFEHCGTPLRIEITNQPLLKSIANVKFPDSLRFLDLGDNGLVSLDGAVFPSLSILHLGNNKITSIDNVVFPKTLTHLSLNDNQISSIFNVIITLVTCDNSDNSLSDSACTFSTPPYAINRGKFVDLSNNMLTSISGATFNGTIEKLDLIGNVKDNIQKNPFTTLPIGATFAPSLTKLFFSDPDQAVNGIDTNPRWRSVLRCNGVPSNPWPGTTDSPNSFDPTTCCMWGGSNAGAPLERLGKCSTSQERVISFRKNVNQTDQRFVPYELRSQRLTQGITSIPAGSFDNCGSPWMLEITDQPLTSFTHVTLPTTLKVLDLGDNQLASFPDVTFPLELRFLYLGNNKITSLVQVTFPVKLTFLDLSRNRVRFLEGVTIILQDCTSSEKTAGSGNLLFAACTNNITGSPMFAENNPLMRSSMILNMQDNLITSIANARFQGSIRTLRLNKNRISVLNGLTFPTSLTTLMLEDNKLGAISNLQYPQSSELTQLNLQNNMISSVTGMMFPPSLKDLNLKNNRISSFASLLIPDTIEKLDVSANPLIGLDFDLDVGNTKMTSAFINTLSLTGTSWLNLPAGLKCIPAEGLRDWVNTKFNNNLMTFPFCKWSVTKCNDGIAANPSNPDLTKCCVWVGSYLGSPVNRSGSCPDLVGAIDLSNRGITAISPGAFENIGKPESLLLNANRIASLRLSDNSLVQLPDTLTYLDLSDNRIESLAGVTFKLRNCPIASQSCLNGKLDTPAVVPCVTASTNQVHLNLQNNLLTSLIGTTFSTENIKLNLANNKIGSLQGVQFPASTRELDLRNNQITSLDGLMFNFTRCSLLNLNANEITSFSSAKFLGVIEQLSLQNVNKKGTTTLAGVTFDLKKCTSSTTCTTTVLLNENRITSLAGAKFSGENYEMQFQDNQISSIAGATFEAKKCKLLDLGNNELHSLAGATFSGSIGTLDLEKNELTSLAGVTFKGSIAILDLKDNLITSLAGVTFDFLKCDAAIFGDDCSNTNPAGFANQIETTSVSFPSINLRNNKITSLAGAKFSGSIRTLSVSDNPLTSLVGIQTFVGITKLMITTTAIPPQGLIGVTLPQKGSSGLGEIEGLTVACIPSPSFVLRTRLYEDFGYDGTTNSKPSFQICAPRFWTRCNPDANVEERCFPSFVTALTPVRPPSAWTPSASNCVPTNVENCCIWSQAFPGAPLVREGTCNQAVGGGIDFSQAALTSFPPGAFDNVGSPRFINLENNGLTSLSGVTMANSLQALFLNNNQIASLAGVTFPASLQTLHLHQNAGLTCVPLPKALVESSTYTGPQACPTTETPPRAPTTARPPSPPSTTPSPPAPAAVPVAKTDNFVQLVVSLPYTRASFDQDKQLKFRAALATSAGTTAENVEITSVTEGRRRQGQGIKVENKIYAKDAASADKLSSTLGTGSGALDKLNSELQKQGLEKSTGLDVLSANKSDNTGLIVGLVVGLGGGAIVIVAIAAYYLYVVKPASQLPPTKKDLENAPVVPPSAPIVAPAASLGVPSPARMPAPSTLVFDAYDFTNWSKSGAPGYQTTQPGYQTTQPGYQSNQPQYGAMPRFNM